MNDKEKIKLLCKYFDDLQSWIESYVLIFTENVAPIFWNIIIEDVKEISSEQ